MTWCRIGLWLTLILLLHNHVSLTQARPQANSTQQNVAVDVTSDDDQVPEARAEVSVAATDEAEGGSEEEGSEGSEGGEEGSGVVEEDSDEKEETEEQGEEAKDTGEVESSSTDKRNYVQYGMDSILKLVSFYNSVRSGRTTKKYNYNNCKLEVTFDKRRRRIEVRMEDNDRNKIMCARALVDAGKFIYDVMLPDQRQKQIEQKWSGFGNMLRSFMVENIDIDKSRNIFELEAKTTQTIQILNYRLKIAKDSTMKIKFKYGSGFSYRNLEIKLEGKLAMRSNVNINYKFDKSYGAENTDIDIWLGRGSTNEVSVRDLCDAFGTQPSRDPTGDEDDDKKALYDTVLSYIRVKGSGSLNGDVALSFQGRAKNIAGVSNVDISAAFAYSGSSYSKATFGVNAQLRNVKPMVFLNYIISQARSDYNNELQSIPIINDFSFDIDLRIATGEIGVPRVGANLDNRRRGDELALTRGTKISFTFRLDQILRKYNVRPKAGTVNPYVEIEITRKGLVFTFPRKPVMSLHDILVACAPQVRNWAWNKALERIPLVQIETFKFNIREKMFNVHMKTIQDVPGKGWTIEKGSEIKVDKRPGVFDFEIATSMRLGGGTMTLKVIRKDTNWAIDGKIVKVSSADFLDKFAKNYRPDYVFTVEDVSVFARIETGSNANLKFNIDGRVTFNGWAAEFELCFASSTYDWSAAMLIQNKGFADIVATMKKSDERERSAAVGWMSQVNFAFMIMKDRDSTFKRKVFTDLLANQKSEGALSGSGIVIIFEASVVVPSDCQQDPVCSFLKDKAMLTKILLRGSLQTGPPFRLSVKAGVEGDIVLKNTGTKVILKSAYVTLVIATGLEFGVEATVDLQVKEGEDPISLTAALKFSSLGEIIISLQVTNWNNPFGLKRVNINMFKMKVGIQFPTFIPTQFALEGRFQIGRSNNQITAALGGGYSIGAVMDYYIYAAVSDFSIAKLMKAFGKTRTPKVFNDISFANVKFGISMPNGRTIRLSDTESWDMSPGLFLSASITVLGYTVSVVIELKIPDRFYLKGTFSPLHLAGGKICLTSASGGETKGPKIEIEIKPKERKFKFELDAAIKVFMFEAKALISITDEQIDFWVEGKFVNLFSATVRLQLPFGRGRRSRNLKSKEDSGKKAAGKAWKFSVCLRTHARKFQTESEKQTKVVVKQYKDAKATKVRTEKIKQKLDAKYWNCYWVAGRADALDAGITHNPAPTTPVQCFEKCAAARTREPEINGVSMTQTSSHEPIICRCEKYMTGITPDDTYKTCFLEPAAFKSDEGNKVGRSPWGMWNNYVQCPPRKRIKGFRLQVDRSESKDIKALNGIEFKCEKLYPGDQDEYPLGSPSDAPYTRSGIIWWRYGTFEDTWTECDGEDNYVQHFSLRSMASGDKYTAWDDDWGALNFKIKCTNNDIHIGTGRAYYDATGYGSSYRRQNNWSGWSELDCPAGKYLCGMRAALESPSWGDDETALNRMQSACCEMDETIERPVYDCKFITGRIQKFDGVDRKSGDKWRGGHYSMWLSNVEVECPKECMKLKKLDDAVNSVMIRLPGNTDTFDADRNKNCLCKRDGGLLKTTNSPWKSCFLVPATSWTTHSEKTVKKWKGNLDGTEQLLKAEIRKMENSKKDMTQSCVRRCRSQRTYAGGFAYTNKNMGGVTVPVPKWRQNLNMRDNPWCLADCATDGLAIFNKIAGGFQLIKFKYYEWKMWISHKIQDFFKGMIKYGMELYKIIREADSLASGIWNAGKKVFSDAANWVLENLLYIEELCAGAGMDEYEDSKFCFTANATIYLGGKKPNSRPQDATKLDNKKICLYSLTSWAFWKDIAQQVFNYLFPDVKDIYEKGKQIKAELTKQNTKEKQLAKKRGEADKSEKEFESFTEADAERKEDVLPSQEITPHRQRFMKAMSEIDEDYVVRDDNLVQAFRDIYDDDDDEIESENVSDLSGDNAANGIQFDPASLTNASEANICRRTGDLVNVYNGAAESYNFLLAEGDKAKKGYEDFLSGESSKFIGLEANIRNNSVTLKLDEDEEEDAMFFVNTAKQGIARRKDRLTATYEDLDKKSLQTWRKYVGEVTSQKQMDIASFLEALSTASKETAKRMEVPNKKLEKTMSSAHKIMTELLGNDDATLSSKKSSVAKLLDASNAIREIAKSNKCFENGLTE